MNAYVWCSFSSPDGFLGVCVVEAPTAPAGLAHADELGIAPKLDGTEALCVPFTIDAELPAELLDHLRETIEGAHELDKLIEPYVQEDSFDGD